MVRILASVRNRAEALDALAAGADFIDLKEPALGALGAVDHATLKDCVAAVGGRRPVSATIGDHPFRAEHVLPLVRERHEAGANFIKIGIFETEAGNSCLEPLSVLAASGVRLVAVLFADAMPGSISIADFADAGFAGIMIDTADKTRGPLTAIMAETDIASFLAEAKRHGLLNGLAGSLDQAAAIRLARLNPDYLGFRGALCTGGGRGRRFDPALLTSMRSAIVLETRQSAA
jgi:uncharacterized protein (UPF0264 family)